MRFHRNQKKLISFVLVLAMLFSLNVSGVQPAGAKTTTQNTTAQKGQSVKSGPFDKINFGTLYEDEGISTEQKLTFDTETVEDALLITGKNGVVSGAAIQMTNAIDFGTDSVSRIQFDVLAKKATNTYLEMYLDDDTEPVVSFRMPNQAKTDNWTRVKQYTFNLPQDLELTGSHKVSFRIKDKTTAEDKKTSVLFRSIQFVQSSIPTVSFDIDEDLGTISDMNNDPEHATECYGKMDITVPDTYQAEFGDDAAKKTEGTYDLEYIRGRGNSTWTVDKKPYKIKLDKKADLFGMGKNKHWVLLANYYDNSLLRNRITYYLGRKLGMEYTPECVPVDVVMNHEYLGSYLLCEQIRLDENRVDEFDLEKADETADITGGYLLSLSPYGDETEYVARTSQGNEFLVESPAEGVNLDKATAYISDYLQKTENAIYGNDFKTKDGTSYKDLMDVQSAVAYYWMQEFSKNGDAFVSTSTYLYKKQNGKLYWGPLWDFDYVAWSSYDYSMSEDSYSGFDRQAMWFSRLMEDPEFAQAVKDYWPTLKAALSDLIKDGGVLDQYADELTISANNNFDKWGFTDFDYDDNDFDLDVDEVLTKDTNKDQLTYPEEIERLKTWIQYRMDWVDENLDSIAPHDITVTYKVDGEVYATKTEKSGRGISDIPAAPTAPEGYIFAGWYYKDADDADDEGYRVSEGDVFNTDVELNAKFISESEYVKAQKILLERDTMYVAQYANFDISYALQPFDSDEEVSIVSSNENVVCPSDEDDDLDVEEGAWFAKEPGTATLTLSTASGLTAQCKVVVVDIEEVLENADDYIISDYTLDKTELTLKPGDIEKLTAVYKPEKAIVTFNWITSDPEIVQVEAGHVVAKKPGTAFVIVTDSVRNIVRLCQVTVQGNDVKPTPTVTPSVTPSAIPSSTPAPTKKPTAPIGKSPKNFTNGSLKYQVTAKNQVTVQGVAKSAKKVTIPATVTNGKTTYKVTAIAANAFAKNKKLTTVVIGKNVTTIGKAAFSGCKKLKKIQVKATKLKKVAKNSFKGVSKKAVVKVPKKKAKAYKKLFKKMKVK